MQSVRRFAWTPSYILSSCLMIVFPRPVIAQTVNIVGTVTTSAEVPIAGVQVRVFGVGNDVTTTSGEFSIRVPRSRIGERVTLQVLHSGWHVVQPPSLFVLVPSDSVRDPIHVIIARNRSS